MPPWLTPLLIFVLCVFIFVLFLPALLELRKPKDAGPRKIAGVAMEKIPRRTPESGKPPKLSQVVREYVPESLIQALDNLDGKEISKPCADTIRLVGEVEFPSDVEIRENLVVVGALRIGDRCRFRRSVKVSKDVQIGSEVTIEGNLVAGGSLRLGDGSVVNGLVDSGGSVVLGLNVSIGLSLTSIGDVELHENAKVEKGIVSRGRIFASQTSER